MTFKDQVAEYITLDNAVEYSQETDKYLWVVDNVLDPLELGTTDARVNWIEDRLDELLNLEN